MSPQLSMVLLGGLTITLNNQPPAGLQSRKARALLSYLAVTGRAHSRSALAGLFWSDVSEASARANLRKELSRMRRSLDDFLIADRETVRFNMDMLVANEWTAQASETNKEIYAWLDVHEFEQLIEASANQTNPIELLTAAITLYQGDFLEGYYVLHAPLFDEWVLLERERLRESAIYVLQTLTNLYLEQNNLPPAIESIHRLLAIEPWREDAHRQLMALLAQNRQRAAALAQYERCKKILAEELDVEPSAATQTLYAQIRDEDLPGKADALPADAPHAVPHRAMKIHNLPAQVTLFVGRKKEVAELQHLLAAPNNRLVTILGPGGMGKTRLAQEVAASLLGSYKDGVFFIPLAPLADPEPIIATISANVGYSFDNEDASLQKQLFEYLHPRNMLLVLDNVEHLLDGVALFTAILEAAPDVQLLVTSRERLRLMSETIFDLGGLPVAPDTSGQPTDATDLFIQTAQRVYPDFTPDDVARQSIHLICQLVGGMPLGLILAASWSEMMTVAEIATEIQKSLDFLAADFRDLPKRQRSLRAVFDATWRLLSTNEQSVFKQLAVFHGDFTRAAAQAVASASLSTLTVLCHKALVRSTNNGRYEIHELLRQFALNVLADELNEASQKHSNYYCAFLQQQEEALKGSAQQAAMKEIWAENQNIRAAWQWAIETKQVDNLLQALESLGLFYLWQSRLEEGIAMFQRALARFNLNRSASDAAQEMSDIQAISSEWNALDGALNVDLSAKPSSRMERAEQLRFVVRTAIWLCQFQRLSAQLEPAQQALQLAQTIITAPLFSDLDTRTEQARLLLEQAELFAECEREWQFPLIEQSVNLSRATGDSWHTAQGVDLLGRGFRETGQLAESERTIAEGLALRQALGDTRGIASSLANLGNTVANLGRFEEAANLYRQSIDLFAEINDRGQQAYQTFRLAAALVHAGQFQESFQLLDESVKLHGELKLPNETGMINILTGFALMHLGDYERAEYFTSQAQSLTGRNTGYVKKDVGRAKQAMGLHAEAQALLEEAAALFRTRNDMNGLGQALGSLGYLSLSQGHHQQARSYIDENLQIAAETHVYLPSLTALAGAALLHMAAGEIEIAVELYTLALQHQHVANSHWFEEVVGQHITAAATLPQDKIEAAQMRGRARNLATTIQALARQFHADR